MSSERSKRLEKTMRGLFLKLKGQRAATRVEMSPGCSFGALVEERLRATERELGEVKGRVNGLLFLLAALVAAEVIMSLVG